MDLTKFSNEELLAELESRSNQVDESGNAVLVVGTVCDYPEGPAVELFSKVVKPEDLPGDNQMLRARFNSHRNYRMFHFKTDKFEHLKAQLDADWQEFSKWLVGRSSVKMIQI